MKRLSLLLLTLGAFSLVLNASDQKQPNIILIFADDVGYGDLGSYGAEVATPELDRLASDGFRATDMQVAANVCGPSRAALMTGRYPMRAGHPISRHPFPKYARYGIAPEEVTMAELLQSAGYHTMLVGKWHLGFHVPGSHPLDAGFDEYLGLHSNYIESRPDARALYRNRKVERADITFEEVTPFYTDAVVDFIHEGREEPFFITFSHHITHSPILPSGPFQGSSGLEGTDGNYADFVLELDHSVGRVQAALKDAGIADNTLVVFLSDNGPARFGSAGPLIGGKYVTTEGGHRVPGIFYWPGQIPAGQVSDALMTSMDLLPLFCAVAGVDLPADRTIDGKNIFPLLRGESVQSPHDYFYYYNGLNLQAVRNERWKLHFPRTTDDQPYWAKKEAGKKVLTTLAEPLLFDLDADVGERRNVISQHPEVVAELMQQAELMRAEIGDVNVVGSDQRPHGLVDPNEKGEDYVYGTATLSRTDLAEIGEQQGVMRRDPSDIIKVYGRYYVWYSKGPISPGYDATVWYATSENGVDWTEQGMALPKGKPGTWEGASVFTPNIMVAEGRYWLFYTGTSQSFYEKPFNPDSQIGIAVSDTPDGPWVRIDSEPALRRSDNPDEFDSHLVDDACLIVRDGRYWFYYKGRQLGKQPNETQMGLAIADQPHGPYIKYAGNPVIPGNHEVVIWPQGTGVAAMIGGVGPPSLTRSILHAEDGLNFSKTHDVINIPHAAGTFRPEAFSDNDKGERIDWGVEIGRRNGKGNLPFIRRFDVEWSE
ncbi:sulfatase-like hydrolase/transferase [Opitutaceae bacterium]|nr:sulfatase-like hydrolase/transferase [Opitutaceae bacterium]